MLNYSTVLVLQDLFEIIILNSCCWLSQLASGPAYLIRDHYSGIIIQGSYCKGTGGIENNGPLVQLKISTSDMDATLPIWELGGCVILSRRRVGASDVAQEDSVLLRTM